MSLRLILAHKFLHPFLFSADIMRRGRYNSGGFQLEVEETKDRK
jgi:hypothetical protein